MHVRQFTQEDKLVQWVRNRTVKQEGLGSNLHLWNKKLFCSYPIDFVILSDRFKMYNRSVYN